MDCSVFFFDGSGSVARLLVQTKLLQSLSYRNRFLLILIEELE